MENTGTKRKGATITGTGYLLGVRHLASLSMMREPITKVTDIPPIIAVDGRKHRWSPHVYEKIFSRSDFAVDGVTNDDDKRIAMHDARRWLNQIASCGHARYAVKYIIANPAETQFFIREAAQDCAETAWGKPHTHVGTPPTREQRGVIINAVVNFLSALAIGELTEQDLLAP